MKNSNKQRGEPLPSELARLLDLEMEDIKHQGTRMKDVAEGDIGKHSAEIVGENNGMNYKKVMRYIRLNYLVPELLDKVDEKKMGFMPAVELSFIRPKNQHLTAYHQREGRNTPHPTPEKSYQWNVRTIVTILGRKEYIGCTVNFRTYTNSIWDKTQRINPVEKQLVFYNTHPAIVSQEVFDKVQELREKRERRTRTGRTNLFSGILYCDECKQWVSCNFS